jgi:hypothetical protein
VLVGAGSARPGGATAHGAEVPGRAGGRVAAWPEQAVAPALGLGRAVSSITGAGGR